MATMFIDTDASKALGDYAKEFEELPYLAEPEDVARAVAKLVRGDA